MDIQIKNLSVSFPSPQGDAKVLRDADIILKSGKITAIVGESGSGKSILGAGGGRGICISKILRRP